MVRCGRDRGPRRGRGPGSGRRLRASAATGSPARAAALGSAPEPTRGRQADGDGDPPRACVGVGAIAWAGWPVRAMGGLGRVEQTRPPRPRQRSNKGAGCDGAPAKRVPLPRAKWRGLRACEQPPEWSRLRGRGIRARRSRVSTSASEETVVSALPSATEMERSGVQLRHDPLCPFSLREVRVRRKPNPTVVFGQ